MNIPAEIDLWSARECGAYIKVSPRQVLERYAPLPEFPRPIRLPSVGGGRGRPLYKAREVIAWAEGNQEAR